MTNLQRRVGYQDISWLMDLHGNDQLDLDPSYQRRSIWSPRDRRYFLDSIFHGYPSPTIFLHKTIDDAGRTNYAVVDGKQRLETVVLFVGDQIAMDREYDDPRLRGKNWSEIRQNVELRSAFVNYQIPVEFLTVEKGESYVNEIFDRLNRNTKKLTNQELRHAKYDRWFITFVEKEAEEEPDWQSLGVVTRSRSKRMNDVQFLSELLIVAFKNDVSGFDQWEIDSFYANLENPEESQLDVECTQDEAMATFANARKFLARAEDESSIVSTHARSLKDFYSVWSVVALNLKRLDGVDDFAAKYSEFMGKVATVADQMNQVAAGHDWKAAKLELPFEYYKNNVGASTEAPQRRARHKALAKYTIGQ